MSTLSKVNRLPYLCREFDSSIDLPSTYGMDDNDYYFNWLNYNLNTAGASVFIKTPTFSVTYDIPTPDPATNCQTSIPPTSDRETAFATNVPGPIRPHTYSVTFVSTVYVPVTVYQTVVQLVPVRETATVATLFS